MKITAEVRDDAAGMTDNEKADLERQAREAEEAEEGMRAESAEFMAQGAEIYVTES